LASISTDAGGSRRILFVAGDGKRRSIRLGKVALREAERICEKVEQLNRAARSGLAPPDEALA
jgi:hypothetical protein